MATRAVVRAFVGAMKNQYFGDINDYRKYGLLRQFAAAGLQTTVAWMLTPDDGSSDGSNMDYLFQPERWERFDPRLFSSLAALMNAPVGRSVHLVENSWVLPDTSFYSELVPQDEAFRARWLEQLVEQASGSDLVFLDPDVGLEVPSTAMGRKEAVRYAYWSEVAALFRHGHSVLIYQHFPREKRPEYISRRVGELRDRTGAAAVEGFETAQVLFLLAAQPSHVAACETAMRATAARWHDQIAACGHWNR